MQGWKNLHADRQASQAETPTNRGTGKVGRRREGKQNFKLKNSRNYAHFIGVFYSFKKIYKLEILYFKFISKVRLSQAELFSTLFKKALPSIGFKIT